MSFSVNTIEKEDCVYFVFKIYAIDYNWIIYRVLDSLIMHLFVCLFILG